MTGSQCSLLHTAIGLFETAEKELKRIAIIIVPSIHAGIASTAARGMIKGMRTPNISAGVYPRGGSVLCGQDTRNDFFRLNKNNTSKMFWRRLWDVL